MALLVLNEWGVSRCEDFGEIVFNMVEHDLLARTDDDSRDDFKGGYSFEEAFRQPYLPPEPETVEPPQPIAPSPRRRAAKANARTSPPSLSPRTSNNLAHCPMPR
jgi:hypothetical protein